MKSVMFFEDGIIIQPHSCTRPEDLERRTTIGAFSNGMRVSLYETAPGELLVKREDGAFICGPEITLPLYKCIECLNDFTRLGPTSKCSHCSFKSNQENQHDFM